MFRAVFYQVGAVFVTAVLSSLFAGWGGAASAGIGGASAIIPNFLFAMRLSLAVRRNKSPSVVGFFVGEAIKVAATIGLWAIAAKLYQGLVWPALLIGLVVALQASFLAFWKKS